jgi:hypothetical protein
MEIHNVRTETDEVNRPGSRIWLMMNDNSKAKILRDQFISKHGGSFYRDGRFWKWRSPVTEKNGYWLKRVDTQEKVFFESMTEFGNKHGLTPVKICELLNGKRKTYKGWTAVEIRAVKEGVGSNIKEKEKKKIKIKSYNGATFQNIVTKEVFYIDNIFQFCKDNGLCSSNLYKVATGKAKSYKNLKLYNPLET